MLIIKRINAHLVNETRHTRAARALISIVHAYNRLSTSCVRFSTVWKVFGEEVLSRQHVRKVRENSYGRLTKKPRELENSEFDETLHTCRWNR